MTGAELRVIWGKNIMDLSPEELSKSAKIWSRPEEWK